MESTSGKYDYATRYEVELKPLPAYRDDSPEEYRAMVAEVLEEIEEEAARKRRMTCVSDCRLAKWLFALG
jgi:hypothetical protein